MDTFLFDKRFYSLSAIGRMQFNKKFNKEKPLEHEVLDHEDIFDTISHLIHLKNGNATPDDIDNLKNRRIKTVGELLAQCFNTGMFRLEKNIREKMIFLEERKPKLQELVNIKLVTGAIHDFFAMNQLSQFMDQTNPLSEMTHKRRLSALGPGGLSRERAGFEVRDVHPSHYGKICPIETPEGSSIGLMSSLTIYAKINDFGFIETPYRKVKDIQLTNEVKYMSALEDSDFYIAQSNALLDKDERFIKPIIALRKNSEFRSQPREWAEWIDLSPHQMVSVAAALIPFLEHDDANRALMGSNMQRQAVPLAIAEAPFVGTGMEALVARDSGMCVLAEEDAIVYFVDARKIIVAQSMSENEPVKIKIYKLKKYDRSNQNTFINQVPLVKKGDKIKKGQVIADGPAFEQGELALGKNVRVAFMPWNGFNYEDSLVVSERLLHRDTFTSIHIEKFEVTARETKIGRENITRDIPNSSESRLKDLDDSGIIRVGSYVKTGDILVGKTTPKAENQLNPEEKLLQAIFGKKAGDIRDTSLTAPQGFNGVVVDVRIFNRRGLEKKQSMIEKEEEMVKNIDKDNQDELFALKQNFLDKHKKLLENEKLQYDLINIKTHDILVPAGTVISVKALDNIPLRSLLEIQVKNKQKNKELSDLLQKVKQQVEIINTIYRDLIEKKKRTEDLPQGVNRIVKVYVATKRKLSVGDKMAGRHGNKGVVSKILPVADMPYTEDGEPIDFILNPLSVPSRMNIGQVLETHLGMVAKNLGDQIDQMIKEMKPKQQIKELVKNIYQSSYVNKYLDSLEEEELGEFYNKLRKGVHFATPVFDGAKEADIRRLMDVCGMDYSGKVTLYDGLTGEKLQQKVTVGYKYMCKLYHLVDDKLHARSTGPYSLVTQQPLGGKSHAGGQRFGEMEVWSLEAYGAAFTLKELLTVKSDDIYGRNKVYESIIKGEMNYESGIPESFKVLVNELRSLCIDLELVEDVRESAKEIVEEN
jgi:DNA-directed RNA polymerase subunit beta